MTQLSPKLTVVTAVYNRSNTVESCIRSVLEQSAYRSGEVEYVIVDGGSKDGTEKIIEKFTHQISTYIRERDNGLYDALNKGIRAAKTDIVGFLHADDLFASPDALKNILRKFESENLEAVYGDLLYVDSATTERVIRYWKSGEFKRDRFRLGWMPPHPSFYVKKSVYNQYRGYRTDMGSAADYECMLRLLYKNDVKVGYLPEVIVKMRVGGKSNASLADRLTANRSDRNAWIANGLRPPFGLRLTKPARKIFQFFLRPPKTRGAFLGNEGSFPK